MGNINNVYFVNPEEFTKFFSKLSYFETLDTNIKGDHIDLSKQSNYLGELMLSIHGVKNTVQDKEERVFKPMRRRFESASRNHAERNIKRLTRTGYLFTGDYLRKNVN